MDEDFEVNAWVDASYRRDEIYEVRDRIMIVVLSVADGGEGAVRSAHRAGWRYAHEVGDGEREHHNRRTAAYAMTNRPTWISRTKMMLEK